ncbi:hypothetical protein TrST_g2597, partial [Triparma strigata]
KVCGKGKYLADDGANENAHDSEENCTLCVAGKYLTDDEKVNATLHDEEGDCAECVPGRYSETAGNFLESSCTNCAAGKYSLTLAADTADTCEDCVAGTYSGEGKGKVCDICIAGKYAARTDEGVLKKNTGVLMEACDDCPSGKWSDTEGATALGTCALCGLGTSTWTRDIGRRPDYANPIVTEINGEDVELRSFTGAASLDDCYICTDEGLSSSIDKQMCKICGAGEFSDGKECQKCKTGGAWVFIFLSFCSFGFVAWYVDKISASRQRMMRLKVLTTFFQTVELTIAIKIGWPKFVHLTIPFSIPIADAECATEVIPGWNIYIMFYTIIYFPIFMFSVLVWKISRMSPRDPLREKLSSTLIFLVVIWYLPVMKMAMNMFPCVDDPDDGLSYGDGVGIPQRLKLDPQIPCGVGWDGADSRRKVALTHSILILAIVGFGLPGFIIWKLRRLRNKNQLVAESPFMSLFQWYTPEASYFEAIHMIRKALLIIMSVFLNNTKIEVFYGFTVNVTFLLILLYFRPLVWYPCSLFPGSNLFLLSEVSSASTTTFGSFLAVIGAFNPNQGAIFALGVIFVATNTLFALSFVYSYHVDMNKKEGKAGMRPLQIVLDLLSVFLPKRDDDGTNNYSRSQSGVRKNASAKMAESVRAAEEEWVQVIKLIEHAVGKTAKERVAAGLPLVRSQLHASIRVEMKEIDQILQRINVGESYGTDLEDKIKYINEKLDGKQPKKLIHYRNLLKKVEQEYFWYVVTSEEKRNFNKNADPALEIARDEGLDLCLGYFQLPEEKEEMWKGQRSGSGAANAVEIIKNPIVAKTRRGSLMVGKDFKVKYAKTENDPFGLDHIVLDDKKRPDEQKVDYEMAVIKRNLAEIANGEVWEKDRLVRLEQTLNSLEFVKNNVKNAKNAVEQMMYKEMKELGLKEEFKVQEFEDSDNPIYASKMLQNETLRKQGGRRNTITRVDNWKDQNLPVLLYIFYERYDRRKLATIEKTLATYQGQNEFLREEIVTKILPKYKQREEVLEELSREIELNTEKVKAAKRALNLPSRLKSLVHLGEDGGDPGQRQCIQS